MTRRSLSLLAAVTMSAVPAAAHATTPTYLPTAELTRAAAVVMRGTVVSRRSMWEDELIVTHVTVQVDECWAGRCGSRRVTVREVGGEVDGLGLLPLEPSALRVGREVVLFARARGALYEAVGGNQGVFTVDPATERAVRHLDAVELPRAPHVPVEEDCSLRSLRRIVREATPIEEGTHRAF